MKYQTRLIIFVGDLDNMTKVVFIFARLIEDSEAYKDKTNADIEKEILKEINPTSSSKITTMCLIPYVKRIEKVTVLDC